MSAERIVATLAGITFAAVLTGCTPATAHVRVSGDARDAFMCAERTLSSRGYDIVERDDKSGVLRAERYPPAVHMRTRNELQRVFVSIDRAEPRMMYVRGDVMAAADFGARGGPGARLSPLLPREIYDDVAAIAWNCGDGDRPAPAGGSEHE